MAIQNTKKTCHSCVGSIINNKKQTGTGKLPPVTPMGKITTALLVVFFLFRNSANIGITEALCHESKKGFEDELL